MRGGEKGYHKQRHDKERGLCGWCGEPLAVEAGSRSWHPHLGHHTAQIMSRSQGGQLQPQAPVTPPPPLPPPPSMNALFIPSMTPPLTLMPPLTLTLPPPCARRCSTCTARTSLTAPRCTTWWGSCWAGLRTSWWVAWEGGAGGEGGGREAGLRKEGTGRKEGSRRREGGKERQGQD